METDQRHESAAPETNARTRETAPEAPCEPDWRTSLGRHDAELFYELLESALAYANARFGICPEPRPRLRGPVPSPERKEALSRLLDALWERPDLIEDFVAENPDGLGPHALEVASDWRHALTSTFICVDAQPDAALYMDGQRVFAVTPLSSPADAHINVVPCLVRLTLLPFMGRIVTDGRIIHLSDDLRPEELDGLARALEAASQRPVIQTARDLSGYVLQP